MANKRFSARAIAERFDKMYEFDRERVTEDKFLSGGKFAAFFAGEHVAATEFVIGPMFVLHGISAIDLFLGLLIGNLLAVLSWTFICAPIAVRVRLTLYWYLRKICGPGLTAIYNIANAFLYCILAGAMISVSATAIGLAFKVPCPALTDVLPNSVGWVVITLCVGAVVTLFAILGFEKVSQFSSVCVPWLFTVFIGGAIVLLPRLGNISRLADFWHIAQTKIWTGIPEPGQDKFTIWHIIFFAWFCNLAMHVDLSDMATLRYAKKWTYGLYSAFGMYPGHYLAWICSGIMVAAVARKMDPGLMAYTAAGLAGAVAVVTAGWTTANPTMYRAGLALQVVTPNWTRWKVTLVAGTVTTILSCFPVFFLRLLDFVAIYGLILMPIGAVVLVEHWIFPRIGLRQYWAEKSGQLVNVPAAATWVLTLGLCWLLLRVHVIPHLFFLWLPGYFIALILYMVLASLFGARAPVEYRTGFAEEKA
jgi:purine-cytosine permease-like protein